jgi:hypothetical protein
MTERSYENAVQVLRSRLGNRYEGSEADGRDAMTRLLREEGGFDAASARDAIDAMIQSGQIRYRHSATASGADVPIVPAPPLSVGTVTPVASDTTGTAGTAQQPGPMVSAGYWQIGREEGESGSPPGRAGQVDPTI